MKLKYGVGVNDADYAVEPRVNGKHVWCPFYLKWHHMLMRCYCEKYKTKNPTYAGCFVCEEWFSFMAFKGWMSKQDWQGKELDKDIAGNGKLYSPENCVFISKALNSFMNNRNARGRYPVGVKMVRSRFQSRVGGKYLGLFNTPEEAHLAWVVEKIKQANELIAVESDARIIEGIRKYIDSIQFAI